MPNIKSAKKRVRQTEKRTLHNNRLKTQMRYTVKKFNEALNSSDSENIKECFSNAVKVIDKAVSKGIIHKNTAARKKSSLHRKLTEANTSAS
ncbi:MAG TPA: 30S ribosomal protein S20 [Thermoanaerobacterales bacterium]|nr:30S ribosomal protein S20 [Thermoanaerobacterales bacterium]